MSSPENADAIDNRWQNRLIFLFSLALVGLFFAPWRIYTEGLYETKTIIVNGYRIGPRGFFVLFWLAPALAVATLCLGWKRASQRRIGTLAAIAAGGNAVAFIFYDLHPERVATFSWGLPLMALAAVGLFAVCGERRLTAPFDLVVTKLSSREAEVIPHWGSVTPDIHFSSEKFYAEIEERIKAKQWPGVRTLRIYYREAGLLSYQREYLRIIRQRDMFDLCAAPFGTDYFFSLRKGRIPNVVDTRAMLVLMGGGLVLAATTVFYLGWMLGLAAFLFVGGFIVWFLFNILKMGLTKLDGVLMLLPAIGAIYEEWFRKDTYFQQDTRQIFTQSVEDLVKERAMAATSEKGIKFMECFERKVMPPAAYERERLQLDPKDEIAFSK